MGRRIVYCMTCGERILEADIDSGVAVSVSGQNYCAKCRSLAPAAVGAAAPAPAMTPATVQPPTPRRDLAPHRPPGTTRRTPHAAAGSSKSTALIAGGVAGAACLALILFVALSGGKTPDPPPGPKPPGGNGEPTKVDVTRADPQKAAREAYESLRSFAAQKADDPDAVIARLMEEMPKLDGTPYKSEAEAMLREAQSKRDKKNLARSVEEILKKAAETEAADASYEKRYRILTWLGDARRMCASDAALTKKVDDAEREYNRRYGEAARKAAQPILDRANTLSNQEKYDEAIAALDAFPYAFAETEAAREIARLKEDYRQKRDNARATAPTLWRTYDQARTACGNDQGEATWTQSAAKFEEVLRGLGDRAKLQQQSITQQQFSEMGCGSYFFLACYHAHYKKDPEKALKLLQLSMARSLNLELIDRFPQLAELRKDPRCAALVTRYKKIQEIGQRPAASRRMVGFQGQALEESECDALKFGKDQGGMKVVEVIAGGAGEKAGMKLEDVVLAFNGAKLGRVDPLGDLRLALEDAVDGKDYDLQILRDGKPTTLKVRWK
jgi:hypothetical protein